MIDLERRRLMQLALGVTAQLTIPGTILASSPQGSASPSPEQSIHDYRRILCDKDGVDVLWWYVGDYYLHTPGESVIPIGRPMTIGVYRAEGGDSRSFRYSIREAGMILDLKSGAPLQASPITGQPITPPQVFDPSHMVEWKALENGNIARQNRDVHSTLNLHWTRTPSNLLLLETEPGPSAFGLVSGERAVDWKEQQSTRTVYANTAEVAGTNFVPAQMIYNLSIKATPGWLGLDDKRERWIIVRGLGTKSRANDIVNPDALALVKQYFPTFLQLT